MSVLSTSLENIQFSFYFATLNSTKQMRLNIPERVNVAQTSPLSTDFALIVQFYAAVVVKNTKTSLRQLTQKKHAEILATIHVKAWAQCPSYKAASGVSKAFELSYSKLPKCYRTLKNVIDLVNREHSYYLWCFGRLNNNWPIFTRFTSKTKC